MLNYFLFGYLIFSTIDLPSTINFIGLFFLITGTLIYLKAIIDFSKTDEQGFSSQGIYHLSRNPMYIGFFLYFLGCSLLIESVIYFIVLMIFQIAVHFIIISEERWCEETFGEDYQEYLNHVRRYL